MGDHVHIGEQVPDFDIEAFDPRSGEFTKISLAKLKEQKKWTVLVFYPADYTFVCPTELADVGARQEDLSKLGVEVISVSTDTKFVHLAWHREEKLLSGVKYLMGADPTAKISRLFGVLNEATGLAYRGTFILNPDGKLISAEVNINDVGRNAGELVRKVKAFQYVAAHPGEVCPGSWTEGSKTLKPGAGLVGRVGDALKG